MERNKLPDERRSLTHRVDIDGEFGTMTSYLTAGYYDNGKVGEIFVNVGKHGSTLQGTLDSWATMVSIAIQSGMPVEDIVRKFRGVQFEPSGKTSNKEIPRCSSLIDYVVQWLEKHQEITNG